MMKVSMGILDGRICISLGYFQCRRLCSFLNELILFNINNIMMMVILGMVWLLCKEGIYINVDVFEIGRMVSD
jgi:hypothetical protein